MSNPYANKWQAVWWFDGYCFYMPYYYLAFTLHTLPMLSIATCRLPVDERLVDLRAIPPKDGQERGEVIGEKVEIFDIKPTLTEAELLLKDQQVFKTPPACGLSRAQRIRWEKLYKELFVHNELDPEHKRARKELRKLQRLAQMAGNAAAKKARGRLQ